MAMLIIDLGLSDGVVNFESPHSCSLGRHLQKKYHKSCLTTATLTAEWHLFQGVPRQQHNIQCDRKVTQPIPDTRSIFSENKLHWSQKTKKKCYINCRKSPRWAMHAFTLFLMSDATRWRLCVTETVHQTRYCRTVWHKTIGKCTPEVTPAS
jgi:hypothetical protein